MTAVSGDQTTSGSYDVRALQEKWQARWAKENPFTASEDPADPRPRRYVLDMFPYPSGDLHMGHAEAFAIGDVIARYHFARGENVLHPIGWDSFGLPAENAAIKHNFHPAEWTYTNIETQAESFRRYAISLDWSRRLHTSDPEYYRWNQWFFLRFFERGLAYRKDGLVNWCPKDQTVLANEQVIQASASAAAPRSSGGRSTSGTSRSRTTPSGCWTTWSSSRQVARARADHAAQLDRPFGRR